MTGNGSDVRQCPRCGNRYFGYPALSRCYNVDVCPQCGMDEALRGMFDIGPKPASEWFRNPKEIAIVSDGDDGEGSR